MNSITKYEIKKLNHSDEFELVIFLNDSLTEFASELGVKENSRSSFIDNVKRIIVNEYPGIKVTMVRVMVSGMILSSFPIAGHLVSAQSTSKPSYNGQTDGNNVCYYVQKGDTLWTISKRFNISIDLLKRANHLSSDILQINQGLIIPKAIHTVAMGDTISTLARDYHSTVTDIRDVNQLSNDTIRVGQSLIIPQTITNNPAGSPTSTESNNSPATYIVLAGDSLSVIAKKYGTTTEALIKANHLSSDEIRIGQNLLIPTTNTNAANQYRIEEGDTLFLLARKFNTSVDVLKQLNHLSSDVLSVGQTLSIPVSNESTNVPPSTVVPDRYVVQEGDTLSEIAKKFNVSVTFLIINNGLTSEMIQKGQVLNLQEEFLKGDRNQIGTVKVLKTIQLFTKNQDGTLALVKTLPMGGTYRVYSIDYSNELYSVGGNQWIKINSDVQFSRVEEKKSLKGPSSTSLSYITHKVVSGDNIWDLSVKYGIPQTELLRVNHLNFQSTLTIGQSLTVPQYHVAVKPTVSPRHGELLDWWTEAQYVVPIGKTFKVIDFATGKTFMVKRTIGANHSDTETLTVQDSNMAKSIWKGYSWTPRAVIVEVDGRKIAASMTFMPHDIDFIKNNGITGHFDIHFKNSTRHKDGKVDSDHQKQINIAAGVSSK